jgi:hypothetical protein
MIALSKEKVAPVNIRNEGAKAFFCIEAEAQFPRIY